MRAAGRAAFPTFDALRGVSALCIMLYHYGLFIDHGFSLRSSYLGVDLFFGLSGFVIAHSYDGMLARPGGFVTFLKVRLIRLYPIYIAGSSLGLAFVIVRNIAEPAKRAPVDAILGSWLSTSVFVPVLHDHGSLVGLFPFDQAAWSLYLEAAVNVLYGALHRFMTAWVLCAIVAVNAVCLVLAAFHYGLLDVGMETYNMLGGLPRVGFSFFAGVLLARTRNRARSLPYGYGLLAVATVVAVFNIQFSGTSRVLYDVVCVLVLFPLALHFGSACRAVPWAEGFFTWAATVSFGVYMFHTPLSWPLRWLLKHLTGQSAEQLAPVSGLVFAAAVLACAHFSVALYDVPVRRALLTLLRVETRTGPRVPEASSA